MKWTSKDVAFAGIYLSLILIMGFTPYIGFVPIPGSAIALIMIPIIIITIHYGWRGALLGMFTFGLVSFIAGFYIPGGHTLIIDQSVGKWFAIAWGGRMVAGIVIAVIVLVTKKLKLFWRMIIAIVSTLLFNAIFYIGMKCILFESRTFWTLIALSWINFVVEWTVIPFITISFYPFLKQFIKK